MSHNVETMAYTNEVPWHGLGEYIAEAPSVDKMLRVAKLNWKVERRPLFTEDGKSDHMAVDSHFALVRNKDNSVLDVVGNKYTPIQNDEAFRFFKEFVEAGDATMETAGSLRNGRYVWGLANLKSSFTLAGGDKVNGYVLVACPHQQGKSMIIKFTSVRVVCNNTLTLALGNRGNELRIPHRAAFDDEAIDTAKETLGIARDHMSEFERNAKALKKLKLSQQDTIRVLAPIYAPKLEVKKVVKNFDEIATPRLKRVMDIMHNAPGAQVGTGWGVLNAVTYYSDHVASRTADKRLTNAWFGRTANQKEAALDTLLEMTQ